MPYYTCRYWENTLMSSYQRQHRAARMLTNDVHSTTAPSHTQCSSVQTLVTQLCATQGNSQPPPPPIVYCDSVSNPAYSSHSGRHPSPAAALPPLTLLEPDSWVGPGATGTQGASRGGSYAKEQDLGQKGNESSHCDRRGYASGDKAYQMWPLPPHQRTNPTAMQNS